MTSRYLGELLRTNYVQIFFNEALNIKNTRNLFKIVQKSPFLTFAVLVAKF